MNRVRIWGICLILSVVGGQNAYGAKDIFCPCVKGPYPKPPKVKNAWKDKKGGMWTLTCTNKSKSGDFVWTYKANPAAQKKVIGRCYYVGGQNCTWQSKAPNGNIKIWTHVCLKKNPLKAIVDIFDKANCKSTKRTMRFQNGQWEEVAARFDTSSAMYAAFSPDDADGDTIPDENFAWITSDLYGIAPPLPAAYETRITLELGFAAGVNTVTWDVGALTPTLAVGDQVVFSDLNTGMLVDWDPRFSESDTKQGLALTAMKPFSPANGTFLATFVIAGPSAIETRWAVVDQTAEPFWSAVFDDPNPLEDLGFSSEPDFSDMPGYASGAGDMVVLFSGGPCCLPDNTCQVLPQADCMAADGDYLGDSTINNPITCTDSDCDGDGALLPEDNCAMDANQNQSDGDGDGVGDVCDDCPQDPDKVFEGVCGCGNPDEGDADGDEWLDCVDQCPGEDDSVDLNGNGISDCLEETIPTVSEWGLMVMTLLMFTVATVVLGRRRAAAA